MKIFKHLTLNGWLPTGWLTEFGWVTSAGY